MPITQQPNENENVKKNVETVGYQFYSNENTMKVNFWNDVFISLKIFPALSESEKTDTRQYDYEKNIVSTAITAYKSRQLLAHAQKLIDDFNNDMDSSYYVDVSGNNLVGFGTKKINDKRVYYIGIHKNLNENKIPEKSVYFYFEDTFVIENYDPVTGSFEKSIEKSGDFFSFLDVLKSHSIAANKSIAHSIRSVLNSTFNRLNMKIDSIANGLKISYSYQKSRYTPNKKLFGGASSQTDTEELDSIIKKQDNQEDSNYYPDDDDIPF